MSDQQRIQGLWQLVSCIGRGQPIITGTTHFHFEGSQFKEIDPHYVNGGDWSLFELIPGTTPKRMIVTSEWTGSDGQKEQRVDRWLYDLDGDTLRVCNPNVWGDYPDRISDQIHSVITLTRYAGPPPQTKMPSGKPPVETSFLGQLTWDNNYDWWTGRAELVPSGMISLIIERGSDDHGERAILAGQDLILWIQNHEADARTFAASELLGTYNESWSDDVPISADAFAAALKMETIHVDATGGASVYFDDGDLFAGHVIIVFVDERRSFTEADIAG